MSRKGTTHSLYDRAAKPTERNLSESIEDVTTSPMPTMDIVRRYLPLIRRIAMTLLPRARYTLDLEDLVSAGTIGLLSALARYDPTRAVQFRTYAEYRIRGMMLDEIRSMDWIPRSVRTKQEQIHKAASVLASRDGRPPTREDIAELLGLSYEAVDEMASNVVPIVSLDESVTQDDEAYTLKEIVADTGRPDPFHSCASLEMNRALEVALQGLTEKQQRVLRLYYFHGWSMKEIGREMNLTESGICRIHAGALRRLQQALEAYTEWEDGSHHSMSVPKGYGRPLDTQFHPEPVKALQ